MQPKAHVVDGVTFVATPYRAGTFIREDVFGVGSRSPVKARSSMSKRPIYGTYWVPSILELGQHGLIEEAMRWPLPACRNTSST